MCEVVILPSRALSQVLKDRREAERLFQASLHGHGHVMSLDHGAPSHDVNGRQNLEQRASSNSEGGWGSCDEEGSFGEVRRTNPTACDKPQK